MLLACQYEEAKYYIKVALKNRVSGEAPKSRNRILGEEF